MNFHVPSLFTVGHLLFSVIYINGFVPSLHLCFQYFLAQGIELSNPQAQGNVLGSGTQSTYFSETGTFSKVRRTQ
jgi:hypothetical protein